MLMDENQAADAQSAQGPAGGEASLEEFLMTIHRLSMALNEGSAFTSQNVGLSEWSILKSLGDGKDVPLRQIERSTGLSRQRIRVLLAQLRKKNLISVSQSTKGDKRVRTISMLPAAQNVTTAVSEEISKLSGGQAAAKQMHSLSRAVRFAKQLVRSLKGKAAKNDKSAKTDKSEAE